MDIADPQIAPNRNTPKKRDILSEKRESGMEQKKNRESTPESGRPTVDTYEIIGLGETGASCYRGRLLQGRFMQNYNTD